MSTIGLWLGGRIYFGHGPSPDRFRGQEMDGRPNVLPADGGLRRDGAAQAALYRRRRLRPSPATLNAARTLGAGMTAVNVTGVLAVSNTSVPPVVSMGGPASH